MFEPIVGVRKGDFYDSNGASLKGYIEKSYNELFEALGEPTYMDDSVSEKVSTEWVLVGLIEDDEGNGYYNVATIYDWKSGMEARDNPDAKYRWHIGGHDYRASEVVDYAIENGVDND